MSKERTRQSVLISLVVIVGALVAVDRIGAGEKTTDAAPSVRTEYETQAELVARMKQFIDSAPAWHDANDSAQNVWNSVQPRLISAPTAELANGSLQQKVAAIVADLGVTLITSSAPSARTPVKDLPLRVVGVTISIKASSPQQLYSFVDRLENMPDAWTHIRRLSAFGPGLTRGVGLNVDIELEALAWITQGAGDAP